jgi:hypothetical protein
MLRKLGILFLLAGVSAFPQDRRVTPLGGGRRMALIFGNDAYPWKPLANAVNDARALAAALQRTGFAPADIALVTDANLKQMQRAGREFVEKLRPGDLAFVYYSGHGVELRGENFLIPVDFPADSTELEVRDEAYSAQQLLRSLEETEARTRILILDACRNNPLRATRSAGGGLARMDGKGTLIVFATSAGSTADDNPRGRNGLFASQLLKALPTPGVTLGQMMQDVARAVYRESGEKQTPAIYGLLLEDFALVAGPSPDLPPVPRPDAAAETWALLKTSQTPEDFDDFARAFPASDLAAAARVRAGQLRRAAAVAPAVAAVIPPQPPEPRATTSFGMSVRALTDLRRQELGIKESGGLEVIAVETGSFAEDIGLAAQDILLSIDDKPLSSTQDLREWQAKLKPGDAVVFRVLSADKDAFGRWAWSPAHYRAGKLPASPR